MKAVANIFGKTVLREIDKETIITNAVNIREKLGDRALLRAIHFFDENVRVDEMADALIKMENASTSGQKTEMFNSFLSLVNESGDSSWELLQNVYSTVSPKEQGITLALALSRDFFHKKNIRGVCRVHGGGFAGTIQAYLPLTELDAYTAFIENIFGKGAVTPLQIRAKGVLELKF